MPKIKYENHRFYKNNPKIIKIMDEIATDYHQRGYELTARQLYYQLVSRNVIENNEKKYNSMIDLLKNARLAGLIDWDMITDRTRNLRGWNYYDSPSEAIERASWGFRLDVWDGQPCYVEVWVEKDALVDVVQKACSKTRTPFFSCRGFTSVSEVWGASQRLMKPWRADREKVIIHLGDHDPSGIDMTRDIQARMDLFGAKVKVERIALNMEQIEQYNPPPNTAKETDKRYKAYKKQFGKHCWELDALRPEVIENLIDSKIKEYLDLSQFHKMEQAEEEQQKELIAIAENYKGALQGARGYQA